MYDPGTDTKASVNTIPRSCNPRQLESLNAHLQAAELTTNEGTHSLAAGGEADPAVVRGTVADHKEDDNTHLQRKQRHLHHWACHITRRQ